MSPEAGTAAADKAVLIVDDYRDMSRFVRRLLIHMGFQDIDEAQDGAAAIDKLKERPYSIVISDLHMEPMNGLALLQAMRADEELKEIPFLIMTADADSRSVVEAKNAGVNGYILKPFSISKLKSMVRTILPA
jgi:two-component system chemotaxis response regulator CheY